MVVKPLVRGLDDDPVLSAPASPPHFPDGIRAACPRWRIERWVSILPQYRVSTAFTRSGNGRVIADTVPVHLSVVRAVRTPVTDTIA
jgi:hypothetical protein